MRKKLQKLIDELKDRKSEAERMEVACTREGSYGIATCYKQRVDAYDFSLQKLLQILKEETAKDLPLKGCTCEGDFKRDDCPHHGW